MAAGSDNLGSAILDLRADDSSLNRGFARADRGLSTITGLFGGVAAKALKVTALIGGIGLAAGGIGAAFGLVKSGAVGMNAQLESSTLQFQTLLGNAGKAEKHVRSLFTFAAQTPFETGPIIAASKALLTFGGQSLATKENLQLVGDAAAAAGVPINEVGTWFGRAYSSIKAGRPFGEAAQRLQEMGILSAEARTRIEDLQKSGASAATVQAALTKEFDRFNGAMKLQAGTWEGLTSTISDNVGLLSARAFRPFFDLLKGGAESVAEFLQADRVTAWADSFAAGLGRVIAWGRQFGTAVLEWGRALWNNAAVWEWAGMASAAVLGFVTTARSVASSLWQSFSTLAAAVGPSLVGLFQNLAGAAQNVFVPAVTEGVTSFAATAANLGSTVLPPIIDGLSALFGYLSSSPETLTTATAAVSSFTQGWLAWKALNIAQSLLALAGPIVGIAGPVLAVVAALAAGALAGQFLVDNWSKLFAQAQQLAISFAGAVLSTISGMLRDLGAALGKIPGIGGVLKAGLDSAADAADEGVAALGEKFNALEPAASKPIQSLGQTVSNLTGGIVTTIKGVAPTIADTLGGAFTTATTAAKAGIASLGDFGPAAKKAGGDAAEGIAPAGEAAKASRDEFDKMVNLFNHSNPKVQIDADEAYGRVKRVSDDYLEMTRELDRNPAFVNLDAGNAQSVLATLGADLAKLDNREITLDADTRAALATVRALPEPIATRTLLIKSEVQGSPRMGFSDFFGRGGYADTTIGGFLSRVSGSTLTLYSGLSEAVSGAISEGDEEAIRATIARERARLQTLKNLGVERNRDTTTGKTTNLATYFETLRNLEETLDQNLVRQRNIELAEARENRAREDRRHSEAVGVFRGVESAMDRLGRAFGGVAEGQRTLNDGFRSGRFGATMAKAVSAQIIAARGSRGYA